MPVRELRPPAPNTQDPTPAVARRQRLGERIERASRLPMVALSIVFLIALVLPELAPVDSEVEEALEAVNWLIWAIFAAELVVMTYLAPDRRRYLMSHWVDVLTVLLPFLRPFRLIRIVIISARLWSEAKVLFYQRTFSMVAMTSLLSALAAATLVYAVERGGDGPIDTFPDALWWAATTVTTVGYGDVFPTTAAGRGIAFFLMIVGISMFGLLTARVAALFVEADQQQDDHGKKLDEILARLERIERRAGLQGVQEGPAPAGPAGGRADPNGRPREAGVEGRGPRGVPGTVEEA